MEEIRSFLLLTPNELALLIILIIIIIIIIIVLLLAQLFMINNVRNILYTFLEEARTPSINDEIDDEIDDKSTKDQEIDDFETCNDGKDQEIDVKTNRDFVLESIHSRKKAIDEVDLPLVKQQLSKYFAEYTSDDYSKNFYSTDYYRLIDLRRQPISRVVVIGDIHCDFISLASLLLKLSVSEYNYFDNAYFVFLGDYMDRGDALFETLLLLMDLKRVLGDRMIMLKGNHESIEWDEVSQKLKPRVKPHESCDCLNEYCGNDKGFLKDFVNFYSTLPIYAYVKTVNKNILLTHASIPRDIFFDTIKFDETDGAMVFSNEDSLADCLSKRNKIFKDMIWGDPSPYEEKMQVEGRFEFGRKQFNQWVSQNHIDLMFRSHEEATFGYKSFFGDRLITIFSTGGAENNQTGYPSVEPAFAIIQNERFLIENSYIYRLHIDGSPIVLNLFSKQKYTDKQQEGLKLGDEFECSKEQSDIIRSVFKHIKASFNSD